eukprot:CAMPEP_0197178476 /NCGR_PEP_ID=MMETSP1423-20130617/3739_1 /TAXON_ID=476441 /ORGANISM="Pseudo-nitzschia heimii, Strain UNC1101" /LENGTH=797 /DNA_ID=CAMNT_0042628225 /DNA_START=220 /DNA_END=2613 /DNA_ORIENTATION=+
MPVDEFGREIPAARNARRSPSPQPRLLHDGTGSGGLPSHLYDPLPTSRYDGDRNDRDRDRDRDRIGDERHSSRKRKHRSRSPPRRKDRSGDGGNERDGTYHQKSTTKPHPSVIYVEEPMLCQYLWKEANEGKTDEDYDEYRKSYSLNYVRAFFNEHMDDSWFRSLYSPLERYELELQERRRAAKEAADFSGELESSLAKTISSSSSNEKDPSFFVLKARLGGGIRQTGKQDYHHNHHSPSKSSRQSSLVNPIPSTHVLALTCQVLPILEVPHYVTDEQLTVALMQQVSSKTSKEIDPSSMVLFSGPPIADLTRTAYLQASDEVRKEIIQKLNHSDRGAPVAKSGKDGASHVPRKEDTFVPKMLELIVECSDAYGRLEVDADGKGGEPEERGGVPPRKASVWISTRSLTPNVQVLSAALSSTERIKEDQTAALKLASAFDNKRDVPREYRLESLLPKAIPNIVQSTKEPSNQAVEDALDVTIAYLRRVHLFSYYNGCQSAQRVAEVFNGNHAVSTIHLRLANADDMLVEPTKGGTSASMQAGNALPKTDLLVQRLNDSIQAALSSSEKWIIPATTDTDDLPSTCIVIDKEVDQQAKDIKYQESHVEGGWIEDHALIDEDGRARCAFHFCRKLFKDSSFLKKHLIKKHSEFLRAEIAKCHDSYMMTLWDAQVQRPVPPILVDCGHRFGMKPSPVLGAAEPIAEDPEPDLWKREEERRLIEEKEAEARRERYNNSQNYHNNNNNSSGLDMALSDGRGQGRKSNFEDVDDMKVEKVEIAFDKIEIPVQPPKKKKKKKKKLL